MKRGSKIGTNPIVPISLAKCGELTFEKVGTHSHVSGCPDASRLSKKQRSFLAFRAGHRLWGGPQAQPQVKRVGGPSNIGSGLSLPLGDKSLRKGAV
jgi:hypothetical protein